mgnify:CR=1 FL=1
MASELFAFPASLPFAAYFSGEAAPWEWVPAIRRALEEYAFPEARPDLPPGLHVEGPVHIDPSARLPPYGFRVPLSSARNVSCVRASLSAGG